MIIRKKYLFYILAITSSFIAAGVTGIDSFVGSQPAFKYDAWAFSFALFFIGAVITLFISLVLSIKFKGKSLGAKVLDPSFKKLRMVKKSEIKYHLVAGLMNAINTVGYCAIVSGVYNTATHLQFMDEFLNRLPHKGKILDAACGAGRYLPLLLEKGHPIIGIDQAQGMLEVAKAKYPGVQFGKVGLQEMTYQGIFDGAICMDAMENVPPEDWSLVLNNFHRALKPHGYLYFTAETIENADDEDEIKQAFERAQQAGLPVVYGEFPDEEAHHFHPTNQQVKEWAQEAGFEVLREANGEIWYYHILVRKI